MTDGETQGGTGLIAAFELKASRALSLDEAGAAGDSPRWLHFDRHEEGTRAWLRAKSGLDSLVVDELVTETTRPRVVASDGGILMVLRGVNLNEGADPADMISLRLWADAHRVITLQGPQLRATGALVEACRAGSGPKSVSDLLVALISGLTARTGPIVTELSEAFDTFEDQLAAGDEVDRAQLTTMRHRVILLHRYLSAQSSALSAFYADKHELIAADDRRRLKEELNRMTRHVEDLEAARGRGLVIQDELSNMLAEQANTRVYIVTMITAIFLPLTLITGMLGMNVGGIPWQEHPEGFWITLAAMGLLGLAAFFVVRRSRWL